MSYQAPWRVDGQFRRRQTMAGTANAGDGLKAQHLTRQQFEPANPLDIGAAVLRDAQCSSSDDELILHGSNWKRPE